MKKIILFMLFLSFLAPHVFANSPGTYTNIRNTKNGTVAETRTDDGKLIKSVHKDKDGKTTEVEERDLKTGDTVTTEYKKGKPKTRTTEHKDESETIENLDKNGRPTKTTERNADGEMTGYTETNYDEKGKVSRVRQYDKNFDQMGETIVTHHDDGTVTISKFEVGKKGEKKQTGALEVDKNGNLVSTSGNITGIAGGTGVGVKTGLTHRRKDLNGNTIVETHNPDGTVDVIHIHKNGQKYNPQSLKGDCSDPSKCPFKHLRPKKKPASNISDDASTFGSTRSSMFVVGDFDAEFGDDIGAGDLDGYLLIGSDVHGAVDGAYLPRNYDNDQQGNYDLPLQRS